jgi:hypothetical protein
MQNRSWWMQTKTWVQLKTWVPQVADLHSILHLATPKDQ